MGGKVGPNSLPGPGYAKLRPVAPAGRAQSTDPLSSRRENPDMSLIRFLLWNSWLICACSLLGAGPLAADVLHVATGNVNLMVLTAETCEGPEAYVGPVFSYYEIDRKELARYADSEWETMISAGELPTRPEWTASFLVAE